MTPRRAGFTLLEMLMAMTIGAMLVLVALGLLSAMVSTDRTLAARYEQTGDLQRVRIVMQRSFSTMLMPKRKQVTRGATARARAETEKKSESDADTESGSPTPRLDLGPDARLRAFVMTPRRLIDAAPAQPQRLELVVTDSPVPDSAGDYMASLQRVAARGRADTVASDSPRLGSAEHSEPTSSAESGELRGRRRSDALASNQQAEDALADAAQSAVRAHRGVFELWPHLPRGAQRNLEALRSAQAEWGEQPGQNVLWELWWVPLPPRAPTLEELDPPSGPVGEPFMIAENLRYVRWTAFDDRQRKLSLQVLRDLDIPAYIELEIETAAGITASWMFEAGYAAGPETPGTPDDKKSGDGKDEDKSKSDGTAKEAGEGAGGSKVTKPASALTPATKGKS